MKLLSFLRKSRAPLLDNNTVIMEIKAPETNLSGSRHPRQV